MKKGKVKNLSKIESRGYGFLLSDDEKEDIFFHVNDKGNQVAGTVLFKVPVFLNPCSLSTGR
jgi:hypothetical protein